MKKIFSLFVMFIFLCSMLTISIAEEEKTFEEKLEELELSLEVVELVIDASEDLEKDVDEIKEVFDEYKEAVEELREAFDDDLDESELNSMLADVYGIALEMQPLLDELGIDTEEEEDKEQKVADALEDWETTAELYYVLLDAAEEKGEDVDAARDLLEELDEHFDTIQDLYDEEDYEGAHLELMRMYITAAEFQDETEKLESFEDDGKDKEEHVEAFIDNWYYLGEVLVLILDAAEDEGKDVDEARELLEEIQEYFYEVEALYDSGDIDEAWIKLIKVFTLAIKFQQELEDIGIDLEDKTPQENVEEALENWELTQAEIKLFFAKAEGEGHDVEPAKSLFEEIEDKMEKAEDYYDDEDYEAAWREVLQVFVLANQFQAEFQKLLASLEPTEEEMKEKIGTTLEEYEVGKELVEIVLEALAEQGKDTADAEMYLNELDQRMQEVEDLYNEGDYEQAMRKMQSAFVYATKLQKELKELEIPEEDLETQIAEVEQGVVDAKEILEILSDVIDVSDAEEMLEDIEDHVEKAREYYDEGDVKSASKELKQVYIMSVKFGKITEDLIEDYQEV